MSRSSIPGRGRRAAAVLLGLLLAGLLVGWTAGPAAADPLDEICKEVPAPVRPDFQTAGLVMDKPDLAEVPDASPDPFKDPKVPISDVYGWAWRYTNYDLGCGSDFIRDPNAVASTNIANVAMAGLATMTSAVNSVENMSRSASFEFLKPVVASIADTLDERVLTVWLPLALLVVSVIVGFGATRAIYSETFRRLLVVVVCVALAVFALVLPGPGREPDGRGCDRGVGGRAGRVQPARIGSDHPGVAVQDLAGRQLRVGRLTHSR